jgi:glycerol-3-phosphate dehydrogenase
LTLADCLAVGDPVNVHGRVVLNTAGIWIDRVNHRATATARRRITGTKGCHIVVRLPPECREYGIATLNRLSEPLYCLPWRGLHYFGPTETLYNGDIEDIRTTEEEIDFLLGEANFLLPTLALKRTDVLYTWAGVRPLTYNPTLLKGSRARTIHDLSDDGMPDVFAVTAGPLMSHRSAARDLTKIVKKRLAPSRRPQEPSYLSRSFPEDPNSPPLLENDSSVRLSDLRHAAEHEYAENLVDLLIRRIGAGLGENMAYVAAGRAAAAVAGILGWDSARIEGEVRGYHEYLHRIHGYTDPAQLRNTAAQ